MNYPMKNLFSFPVRLYRCLLILAFAASCATGASAAMATSTTGNDDLVVTFLGTGTPRLNPDRFGPANLVQAGGVTLLFDAGRGATVRLAQAGVQPSELDGIFLTHFHSDHVNGLADIFLTGYIASGSMRARKGPFRLYGPKGTRALADGILQAHSSDIETRIRDENVARVATTIEVVERESGVIFEKNGVTVTIFPVLHGELIKPATGYRVDYKGKSVVFSGDTTFDTGVARQAAGADVLVHEVALADEATGNNAAIRRIMAHHTSPEDAGRIFSQAAPKVAVFTHIVFFGGSTAQQLISRTRETYQGSLVIAEDLSRIIVSDNGMTIFKVSR